MHYILFKNSEPMFITTETPWTGTPVMKEIFDEAGNKVDYDSVLDHHDFTSFEQVESILKIINEKFGTDYIATDAGEHCSPRFGIAELPKVGDDVSYGFNGDYYPCGKIVRVTPSLTVIAEDTEGHQTRFRRVKKTGGWKREGGTWWMVQGVVSKLNPEV